MFYEAFLASRGTQYEDQGDDFHPTDSFVVANWLDEHETIQDYDRSKRLKAREWKEAKAIVTQRDGFNCIFPDTWHNRSLQDHHLVPLHAGGEPTALSNLARLCTRHHILMHPGLGRAYDEFQKGNKEAFHEFAREEHKRKTYDPPKEADILKGMVMERTMNYIVAKRQHLYETQGGNKTR